VKRLSKTLNIQSSPHLHSQARVDKMMLHVVLALLPTVGFAIYAFGWAALFVLVSAILSCLLTEHLLCQFSKQTTTVSDGSAVVTGLIYGLTLPPGLALWMVVLGGMIAIGLGKFIFGGLGCNPFNPALVGRAFLQATFPLAMTSWITAFHADRFTTLPASTLAFPFTTPNYDQLSGATPLAAYKFDHVATDTMDLAFGLTTGSVGESCAVLILLGGIYLIWRKMMNWRIPAGIFLAVLLLSGLFHWLDPVRYPSPIFMLFSGGLMLGAMFMATDMVSAPITAWGCFVYGLFIGILVVVIRLWAGMPEGVMYAILLGNAVAPYIDRLIQPRAYGKP